MADVDEMGTAELLAEMNKFFGTRRTASMIGWLTLFGAIMHLENFETVTELIEYVTATGYGRRTVLDALADTRRFALHVKEKDAPDPNSLGSVRALAARLKAAHLTL